MARSAKTTHVLSLVGEKSKKNSPTDGSKRATPSAAVNPVLFAIEGSEKEAAVQLNSLHEQVKEPTETAHSEAEGEGEREYGDNAEKVPPQPVGRNGITAIVPELINQELKSIVERFHIEPNDNNLWRLTKAALETIRPEFSHNSAECEEKCSELRQKVILEMTKAAIKLSKESRKM